MNLTQIARKTIELSFKGKTLELDKQTKEEYKEKRACFVTLTNKSNNDLRGCIGSLIARQELWKDVQENALNAAFRDPRFTPLSESELDKIKLEVSILSPSKKLEYKDEKDLLNKINHKMGLVLKKGFYSATFLPQVWSQLPEKIEFLQHLSLKAGLNKDAWKTADIFYYTVKIEEEKS
ncbi:MAG: AmmeMemoRadiSam system protein A [Candidatus Pacearchaeota archaeon]|jgi:AmmeMemoRadiSam system protein A